MKTQFVIIGGCIVGAIIAYILWKRRSKISPDKSVESADAPDDGVIRPDGTPIGK